MSTVPPSDSLRPAPRSAGVAAGAGARRAAGLRFHLVRLAALVLAPALAAGALAAWWAVDAYRAAFERRLEDTARAVAVALDGEIERLKPVAAVLAASPLIAPEGGGSDFAELHARAKRLADALGTWAWMIGPPPDRAPVFHTALPFGAPSAPGAVLPDTRAAVAGAEASAGPLVGDLAPSAVLRRRVAAVVVPVRREGRPVGAFGMTVDPRRMSDLLAAHGFEGGAFAALVDGKGALVARSSDADRLVGRQVPDWYREETARRGRGVVVGRAIEGREMVFGFARLPNTPAWSAVVAEPRDAYQASWRRPLLALAAGGVLAVALAAGAAALAAVRLLRPLKRLADRAAAVSRGEAPLHDDGGGLARVSEFEALGASVDAADAALRREAEAARRERELLRSVVEGTGDAVFAKDMDGRYVLANAAALAALGRQAVEVLGRTDAELLPLAAPGFTTSDRRVLTEGRALTFEDASPDPAGGPPRVFLSTKAPWRDPATGAVVGIVGVAHDITGRLAAEARLREAERGMQHLARRATVGAMASGIAHELNQPLGAATNFLDGAAKLLEDEMARAAPPTAAVASAARALRRASGQVVRAGEILRRLRDFIGRGETERRAEPVAEVVEEAVALAFAGATDAGLDAVRVEAAPNAGRLWMDRVQVQQVVVNLVRNAVEAMRDLPPGAPRELTVRVSRRPGGGAEVSVADTGPGIPPEAEARLFEPFHSTKPGGMGVGLSICRAIVEAHGGRLSAGPADGGAGAVFRFTLAHGRAPTEENPALRADGIETARTEEGAMP